MQPTLTRIDNLIKSDIKARRKAKLRHNEFEKYINRNCSSATQYDTNKLNLLGKTEVACIKAPPC